MSWWTLPPPPAAASASAGAPDTDADSEGDDPWGEQTAAGPVAPPPPPPQPRRLGVTVETLMRLVQQWPLAEAPEVTWEMPYYAQGVYEEGNKVHLGTAPDGRAMTVPIPPLLQRRRRQLVCLWTRYRAPGGFPLPACLSHMPQAGRNIPPYAGSAASAANRPYDTQDGMQRSLTASAGPTHGTVGAGVACTSAHVPGCARILEPFGGLAMPCPAGVRCQDVVTLPHRRALSHPCPHGATCTALRSADEGAQQHLVQFEHPADTVAAIALLNSLQRVKRAAPP